MDTSREDPDAGLVALLTSHQSALRLYVHSLMPGDSAAADVTQQANTTIWKKREDFTPTTNFKAWIFAIARYEVLNHRKRLSQDQKRLVFSETLEDLIAEELPQHDRDLEAAHSALERCLSKLRPQDRELIHHRYQQRPPLKDYATQVKRSASGLRVTLYRIRNALAKCIANELAKEGRA